jgi:hypothetical protein
VTSLCGLLRVVRNRNSCSEHFEPDDAVLNALGDLHRRVRGNGVA